MRSRKFIGPLSGVAVSLVLVGVVLASTTTGSWTDAPVGKNSPIFQNISSQSWSIRYCVNKNSDLQAYFDWMHHWPILPSTGTDEKDVACRNTSTWRTMSWSAGSRADYSVEYTHTNNSKITTRYSTTYND
jgi:hypothetical protein